MGERAFGEDACVMEHGAECKQWDRWDDLFRGQMEHSGPVVFLEPADLAEMLRHYGSTCRTPGAVRAGVRDGRFRPSARTLRGTSLWSWADAYQEAHGDAVRRRYRGQIEYPRQLKMRFSDAA